MASRMRPGKRSGKEGTARKSNLSRDLPFQIAGPGLDFKLRLNVCMARGSVGLSPVDWILLHRLWKMMRSNAERLDASLVEGVVR